LPLHEKSNMSTRWVGAYVYWERCWRCSISKPLNFHPRVSSIGSQRPHPKIGRWGAFFELQQRDPAYKVCLPREDYITQRNARTHPACLVLCILRYISASCDVHARRSHQRWFWRIPKYRMASHCTTNPTAKVEMCILEMMAGSVPTFRLVMRWGCWCCVRFYDHCRLFWTVGQRMFHEALFAVWTLF